MPLIDERDEALHRQWCDMNVYTNLYDSISYTRANYKVKSMSLQEICHD